MFRKAHHTSTLSRVDIRVAASTASQVSGSPMGSASASPMYTAGSEHGPIVRPPFVIGEPSGHSPDSISLSTTTMSVVPDS